MCLALTVSAFVVRLLWPPAAVCPAVEYLQSYAHVFVEALPATTSAGGYSSMGRRTSEASISSTVSGLSESLPLSTVTSCEGPLPLQKLFCLFILFCFFFYSTFSFFSVARFHLQYFLVFSFSKPPDILCPLDACPFFLIFFCSGFLRKGNFFYDIRLLVVTL